LSFVVVVVVVAVDVVYERHSEFVWPFVYREVQTKNKQHFI